MAINATRQDVYTDCAGLTELRRNAHSKQDEVLRAAGKHFEAMFIQMMLQSMRDASPGDPLLGGGDQELYQGLFDKQISLALAARGSLGLAETMTRQLTPPGAQVDEEAVAAPVMPQRPAAAVNAAPAPAARFESPADFVQSLWPAAQGPARELGVDPRVLIAQAALETGWGKSVMRDGEGRSSHNLFGIKAGADWEGRSVSVSTLEYRDGVAVKERAAFRAYDSIAESFADYVDFIKSNPRYREVLEQGGDAAAYLRERQAAGYATDPRYAEKIGGILRGEVLSGTPEAVKGRAGEPIV